MEFKQLEAFVQISKLQSFSKASESLYLTQPALSSQINALEKELGTQLFIRSTKKVYPTKAGMDFYEYAQKILALREQSIFEMNKFSKDCAGEINILASSVPAQYILPPLIASFNQEYPNIMFRMHERDSGAVYRELIEYQYDIGFVGTEVDHSRYRLVTLCKDQLVLILPQGVKQPAKCGIEDIRGFLLGQKFIMRERGSGTRAELEVFLSKQNISEKDLNTIAYFSSTQGILEAVSRGMGISFVSKSAAKIYKRLNMIEVVELESEVLNRNIYYVLKKDMILTPAQELFIHYAENRFAARCPGMS